MKFDWKNKRLNDTLIDFRSDVYCQHHHINYWTKGLYRKETWHNADNYRGITLTCTATKTYNVLIPKRNTTFNNILDRFLRVSTKITSEQKWINPSINPLQEGPLKTRGYPGKKSPNIHYIFWSFQSVWLRRIIRGTSSIWEREKRGEVEAIMIHYTKNRVYEWWWLLIITLKFCSSSFSSFSVVTFCDLHPNRI